MKTIWHDGLKLLDILLGISAALAGWALYIAMYAAFVAFAAD